MKVVIVGAGSVGSSIARELLAHPDLPRAFKAAAALADVAVGIVKTIEKMPGGSKLLKAFGTDIAAMTANARYLTRAPKGIFFYKNHEEMIRDRERWTIEAMLARQAERG